MKVKYSDLIYRFQNKWVAVDYKRTKVIAAANSINELSKKIKNSREKDIIFSFVLPENRSYSPVCH